jgi:hypothetical protein
VLIAHDLLEATADDVGDGLEDTLVDRTYDTIIIDGTRIGTGRGAVDGNFE